MDGFNELEPGEVDQFFPFSSASISHRDQSPFSEPTSYPSSPKDSTYITITQHSSPNPHESPPATPSPEFPPLPLPRYLTTASAPCTPRSTSRAASPSTTHIPPHPRPRSTTPSTPLRPRRSLRVGARPQGPPELEAALRIAIRNLESDIFEWWCAHPEQRRAQAGALPTPNDLKRRSLKIRRAAEAVDEADKILSEAVYGSPLEGKGKGRGRGKKKQEGVERAGDHRVGSASSKERSG